MKKSFLTLSIIIGACSYGFATNQFQIQTQSQEQTEKEEPKKRIQRYDFSLFKFVLPPVKNEEIDTIKVSEELKKQMKLRNEITFYQEKPLSFFKFS